MTNTSGLKILKKNNKAKTAIKVYNSSMNSYFSLFKYHLGLIMLYVIKTSDNIA